MYSYEINIAVNGLHYAKMILPVTTSETQAKIKAKNIFEALSDSFNATVVIDLTRKSNIIEAVEF